MKSQLWCLLGHWLGRDGRPPTEGLRAGQRRPRGPGVMPSVTPDLLLLGCGPSSSLEVLVPKGGPLPPTDTGLAVRTMGWEWPGGLSCLGAAVSAGAVGPCFLRPEHGRK